jgi:hypothetical protein
MCRIAQRKQFRTDLNGKKRRGNNLEDFGGKLCYRTLA